MKYQELRDLLTEEGETFRLFARTTPSMGVVKVTRGAIVSAMLEGLHEKTLTLVVKDPGQYEYTFFDEPITEQALGIRPTGPESIRSYRLENISALVPMEG